MIKLFVTKDIPAEHKLIVTLHHCYNFLVNNTTVHSTCVMLHLYCCDILHVIFVIYLLYDIIIHIVSYYIYIVEWKV